MAALQLAAAAVRSRELERVGYATDALGGEYGIGLVAVTFAVALAVASVAAGRFVDTHDPRPLLVAAPAISGLLTAGNALILARGTKPVGWLLTSTVVEAAAFGMATTGLVKVQAAIVAADARGGAETVNILRSGLGVAAGTVAAGVSDTPIPVLAVSAVVTLAMAVATAVAVWPVAVPAPVVRSVRAAEVAAAVRAHPALQRTVVVDLVLALVLPTQFIALVVVVQDATEVTTVAFTASLLGLLVGRLTLVIGGLGGNLTRRIRTSYLGFTALMAIAVPSLVGGWTLTRPVLVAACLFVGGALLAFTQNLPIALVQQLITEKVHGALSGTLNAARNLVIAASAATLTALTAIHSAAWLAAATTGLLVAGYLVAGRMRGLASGP